jgi:dTDP-4-dehydrorhamnose reductase
VTLVLRTPCSVMSCDKLTRDFGLRPPDWRDSLIQVLQK